MGEEEKMISLENLLILNVLAIVSLLYSVTILNSYPVRAFAQIISSTIFMFTGALLLVVVNPYVGTLYLSLAMLVMVVAFTDYLSVMRMNYEIKEETAE